MTGISPIGLTKDALDTPALLVDLNAMESNIEKIAQTCALHKKAWRPHFKSLKVPAIVLKAQKLGAIGATCAKLEEAELLFSSGIDNVLIANQIVGESKLRRLGSLCRQSRVIVAVDDWAQVAALGDAAHRSDCQIGIVIEVDVGLHRAGVELVENVVVLAEKISSIRGLQFLGLMGWEGHACEISDPIAKQKTVTEAMMKLSSAKARCEAQGLSVQIVSAGGSGTYSITAQSTDVTEIQAGGAILGDVLGKSKYGVELECALTVISTVTSRPTANRIVCDAGFKSMSGEYAVPELLSDDLIAISTSLSAEHCAIELSKPSKEPRIGQIVEFVVSYADATVHLHDTLFGCRDGKVETVWPISGRGKFH